jgi:hypothetical protein
MNFRTEIEIAKANFQFSHNDKIVLLGSCFSENIGHKLQRCRFQVTINSHGIVFNPESAAIALEDVIDNKRYSKEGLIHFNGYYVSFNHHGKFNHENADVAVKEINDNITYRQEHLKHARVLFVTFGSAWAYRHKETKGIVTNCHKIPQSSFEKVLLSHEEIIARWSGLLEKLYAFNKDIKVVFTVSPVRYWRDGALQNQISKSHLIIAVHALKEKFNFAHYFPSYELVMDDLRDYRFFKEDMLHPNEVAINYIWEKLAAWCMSDETRQKLNQLEPLLRFTEHRPINSDTKDFEIVLAEKERQIQQLIL